VGQCVKITPFTGSKIHLPFCFVGLASELQLDEALWSLEMDLDVSDVLVNRVPI
jgi:hypothetical protein